MLYNSWEATEFNVDEPGQKTLAEKAAKIGVERLLRDLIHEDGGPLIHNGEEETQRSFDSTCRKLHRFLTQPQR